VRYFLLIIAILFPAISEAQLTAPGMSTVRHTSYPSATGEGDPVFIYCNTSGSQSGTLNANSPGGTGPFNFSWFQWSNVTKDFTDSIKTDPGVLTSSIANLSEGGYKVIISGGFDTSLVGWVFVDRPNSSAELPYLNCNYVALKGEAAIDPFYYRDPSNGDSLNLPNEVQFLWSSDPISTIPFPDLEIDMITYDPPLVDVTYKLHVIDSFGCISESLFLYESIHVKADFSVNPDNGEAPLEVTFTDNSIRGLNYKWEFGDSSKDSISYLNVPDPHIFYKPGEYIVKLSIESEKHCIDSMWFEKIVVDLSDLGIPNVFTPDGDGINDYFIVYSKSLRYINVEVFTRSGMKIYSFYGEGEGLKEWQGWNGNVNTSSIKASPGVYFYLIRAYGWDDINYDSKEYRGFVYLYR